MEPRAHNKHKSSNNSYCLSSYLVILAVFCQLLSIPFTSEAHATTIFTENFDSLPDQSIKGRCRWEGDTYDANSDGIDDCDQVPANWDFIYTADRTPTNPPGEITSAAGKTGKGLRVYDESYGTSSQWGHDIQLAKHFSPSQYQELWISLWIKFNPNISWGDFELAKIFRMGHYNPDAIDGTLAISVFQTNTTTTAGLMFYDVGRYKDNFEHKISLRGNPSYKFNDYNQNFILEYHEANGEFVDKTWSATLGDDQWHKFEIGMIMNSSAGAKDGEVHLYFDGVYQGGRTNVPWLETGHNANATGFNMFTVAGNAHFIWDGQSEAEVHFYDIDDIEVCTTRCIAAPHPPSHLRLTGNRFSGD